ncbi:RsmB/NOP family class I SAM-dependent RNA methyltransferase [Clostridium tarantellae]|uniref:NOL1/NOP2/sun family putative RNA methylase n=1 Tax=Clostridium tarantellae TaxID=39493 RepID=A0A6I1MJ28_9CLOT|nr:RsmB/NOP family class I SAM-dependent RNA methyltransferase [Clostridium tarantellae]MPQ42703.1 NOL1/NOP2/sun family putative RNA methylase [Clostridium tarantellae]
MGRSLGIRRLKEILPSEFVDMLYNIYTIKEVDQILTSYLIRRKSTFRVNKILAKECEVIYELNKNGIKYYKYNGENPYFLLKNNEENIIRKLECYKKGEIYFQNPSSIIPSIILNPKKDDVILDMCAAPGGKTIKIAEIIRNTGKVIANEINSIRYERLKYNIKKHGVKCVECINKDGRFLFKEYENTFHKILIDAPCSGEGTMEILKNKKVKIIKNNKLIKVQKQLIESAYKCLKKGGYILYSTCTLSPKENEEIINYILNKHKDLRIESIDLNINNKKLALIKYEEKNYNKELKKALRIIPNDVMEGFFLCKLKKC